MAERSASLERSPSPHQATSRIHFSPDTSPYPPGSSDGSSPYSSLGRGHPPGQRRRSHIFASARDPVGVDDDVRRRVRSIDGINMVAGPSGRTDSHTSRRAVVENIYSRQSTLRERKPFNAINDIAGSTRSIGSFSDENLGMCESCIVFSPRLSSLLNSSGR
jgi:hypothetical protein